MLSLKIALTCLLVFLFFRSLNRSFAAKGEINWLSALISIVSGTGLVVFGFKALWQLL